MNKRVAVLLGGVAALMTAGAAQAAPAAKIPAATSAAQSYAELLEPIPNARAQLQADNTARALNPPARLQLARFHHHHHHHHHGGFFPGAIVGGIIGGALASAPPDYYYGPPPAYYEGPPGYGSGVAYCMRRFKSYDPASGTYLGYDGYRHPCP